MMQSCGTPPIPGAVPDVDSRLDSCQTPSVDEEVDHSPMPGSQHVPRKFKTITRRKRLKVDSVAEEAQACTAPKAKGANEDCDGEESCNGRDFDFLCKYCGKRFDSKRAVASHMGRWCTHESAVTHRAC